MIRTTIQGVPTATNQILTYEIVEKLNRAYCVNAEIQPIVTVTYSTADTELVGTTLYATIQALIQVSYKPKGCGCNSGMVTNTFTESFVVSFAAATSATTIQLVNTPGYTDPAYLNNCNCCNASGIKQVGQLSITAQTA